MQVWRTPNGETLDFPALLSALEREARNVVRERIDKIDIAVVGINFH
jgi:hypothetical protein